MAINYTDVFTTIGQYVAYDNALRALATNLYAYRTEFATQYDGHGVLVTPYGGINDILTNIASAQQRCATAVTNLLLDNQFIVPDLSLGVSYTLDDVLQRLHAEMVMDEKFLKPLEVGTSFTNEIANGQVASGSIFAATHNLTVRAPGNIPLNNQIPRAPYYPFTSYLNEALTPHSAYVRCTSDAEGSATLGMESFVVEPTGSGTAAHVRAAGQGPPSTTVTTGPAKTLIPRSVGNFSTFTLTAPQGFTPHGCVITTDFDQSTTTVFNGVGSETTKYSLRCKGSSAVKVVLETSIPEAQLVRGQLMGLYVYYYTAGTSQGFTLAVNQKAQDASPGTDIASTTASASDPGSVRFQARLLTFSVPTYLSGPLYLRLEVPSANTDDIFFAEFGCAPYDFSGGGGLLILPGHHQTLVGDRTLITYTRALSGGTEGLFQEFFANYFGFMFPATDSLVTGTYVDDTLIQDFTISGGPTP